MRTYFSLKVEVRRYFLRTLYQFIVPEFKVVICTAIMYQIGILTYSIPLSFFLSLFGNQLYYLKDPTPTIILSIYYIQIRTYIHVSYTNRTTFRCSVIKDGEQRTKKRKKRNAEKISRRISPTIVQ